ncbi:hypothetical protein IFM89_028022 [Coptis chinensis]|uniref:Uncharacterized protein n=1 Tax=Coptis chinensis TaxID=261450 RepID=A0A835LWY0_9MAGN|nr:hypothetical protein IFM89_028022 [Coptis chinensis]
MMAKITVHRATTKIVTCGVWDNFKSGWESLLLFVRKNILNGSKEVAFAAINYLQTTALSHSLKKVLSGLAVCKDNPPVEFGYDLWDILLHFAAGKSLVGVSTTCRIYGIIRNERAKSLFKGAGANIFCAVASVGVGA